MRKVPVALLMFAVACWAADFWQAKPYAEWTDKDAQRMMTNSPWARQMNLSMNGPTPPNMERNSAPNPEDAPQRAISETTGRGGRGAPQALPPGGGPEAPSLNLVIRWQSAVPMKQAVARTKWGSEVGASAEAKSFLERQEPSYIISVSGVPRTMVGDQEQLKSALKDQTTLVAKGKDKLMPSDIQFSPNGRAVDVYFLFPKSAAFSADDKEVEFSTRLAGFNVKNKFRFKDMVVNGKLEL